jgi:hypothetical protein
VHAFFAEREAAKSPETRSAQPRPIASVGIIGGGTMGAGIAVAVLDAGLPVVMIERDDEALARGRANVEKVYTGLIAQRAHEAGSEGRHHGALERQHRVRRLEPGRPRDRSRVRRHGGETGRIQGTRPRLQAGRRAGHEYFLPRHRPDRGLHLASAGRDRPALLLAGEHHEAARDRGAGESIAPTSSRPPSSWRRS